MYIYTRNQSKDLIVSLMFLLNEISNEEAFLISRLLMCKPRRLILIKSGSLCTEAGFVELSGLWIPMIWGFTGLSGTDIWWVKETNPNKFVIPKLSSIMPIMGHRIVTKKKPDIIRPVPIIFSLLQKKRIVLINPIRHIIPVRKKNLVRVNCEKMVVYEKKVTQNFTYVPHNYESTIEK